MMRLAHRVYAPILRFSIRFKTLVLRDSRRAWHLSHLRSSRQPGLRSLCARLSEGASRSVSSGSQGTDIDDSVKYNTQMEQAVLAEFPDEVEHVWSRSARPRLRPTHGHRG
jgi:cobalt-zinc-cadmium resistance protein CzcA